MPKRETDKLWTIHPDSRQEASATRREGHTLKSNRSGFIKTKVKFNISIIGITII